MTRKDAGLRARLSYDNYLRLLVSSVSLVFVAAMGATSQAYHTLHITLAMLVYTALYAVGWWLSSHLRAVRPVFFVLGLLDFAMISYVVRLTGEFTSPFFCLYSVPFLVHTLYADLSMLAYDVCLGGASAVGLFVLNGHLGWANVISQSAGQLLFLTVAATSAFVTSGRLRNKERSATRSHHVLNTTVRFLERLNSLSPMLPKEALEQELLAELDVLLKPLGVSFRLWIANQAWKTLEGRGEHPALRPGSAHHLPMVACPAFALRREFRYDDTNNRPCPTEQFNYSKHLCVPIMNEMDCQGVLFLASYAQTPWREEESHLFGMLAHSIALILQRRNIFDSLQEKISELNFSFEVGATGLATFVGSTQSIDETTVNILDGVLKILRVDRASLMIWDPQDERLQTQWVRGGDFKVESPLRLGMGQGIAGWALQTGQCYWAEYAMGDPHFVPSGRSLQSIVCMPLFAMDGKPLGVINAQTTNRARAFNARETAFLRWFGQQAALAIENAQLHHRSRHNIDQLSEVSRMKSEFFSLVSHDLRGPLTGMRGFCEILKAESAGTLTDAQKNILEQLDRQVDLQERMVDDLLDFARMENGHLSIVPERVDVHGLVREEVDKARPEAKERGLTLQLAMEDRDIPAAYFDGARLRQVIWNLLHNAMKFTQEGGRIDIRVQRTAETVEIEVRDTGVGLSFEAQEKIFDKFFQVSPGGSRGAQGLGLGLAICKEIVLAHQGKIRASSPGLGKGTTFSISFPLLKAPSMPALQSSAA